MNDAVAPTLSIVIPTMNAASTLPACLEALETWPDSKEIIVVDGGSEDETLAAAHKAGTTVLPTVRGRGEQLRRGGAAVKGDWLLFVHADTVLDDGWVADVQAFINDIGNHQRAAAFRFALADETPQARRVERLVAWRCRRLGLPYGDQGLLIHSDLYTALGGYKPLPLMEDVDLVRRIGRCRVHVFDTDAVTSAVRYQRDGWWARPSRNVFCLLLYLCGLPPRWIAKVYG
jgi:rSAM/selenodomain-associated transferase 2